MMFFPQFADEIQRATGATLTPRQHEIMARVRRFQARADGRAASAPALTVGAYIDGVFDYLVAETGDWSARRGRVALAGI